jgi:hypothetical protein
MLINDKISPVVLLGIFYFGKLHNEVELKKGAIKYHSIICFVKNTYYRMIFIEQVDYATNSHKSKHLTII